jgi:hypothetical protein
LRKDHKILWFLLRLCKRDTYVRYAGLHLLRFLSQCYFSNNNLPNNRTKEADPPKGGVVPRSLRGARVRIGAMWSSSSGPEDPVSGKLPLLSQCYFSNNNLPNNRTNQKKTLQKEEWFLGVCAALGSASELCGVPRRVPKMLHQLLHISLQLLHQFPPDSDTTPK